MAQPTPRAHCSTTTSAPSHASRSSIRSTVAKRAFDLLNCITVVPGALGAWRKQAIEAAGGITADTVAEDADLTVAIRRLGWRISYEERAIAWTEAPETPSQLIRQ